MTDLPPGLLIADCSEFQGTVDWAAYATQNQAAIARVCYGTAHTDKQLGANLVGMRANLRVRGWYQYLVWGQDVVAQAKAFAALLGPLQPGEFAIVDAEEGSFTQADMQTWIRTVHGLIGGVEGEYSGVAFARTHLADFTGSPLTWVAAYQATEPTEAHRLWQFTDKHVFPGIPTPCDASIFHGSIDDLLALVTGQPRGADMRVIRNTDNGRCYLAGVGQVQWLETGPQLSTWLRLCAQAAPEPVTTVDLADFTHTNAKEPA